MSNEMKRKYPYRTHLDWEYETEVKSKENKENLIKKEPRAPGLDFLIWFGVMIGVFSVFFLAFVIYPIWQEKRELSNIDPTKVDGKVVIHVQDKTKQVKNDEIIYYVSITEQNLPWDLREFTSSLIKVDKTTFDQLDINMTYEVDYHKKVNGFDHYPNILNVNAVMNPS